jgi:hypothetical protein
MSKDFVGKATPDRQALQAILRADAHAAQYRHQNPLMGSCYEEIEIQPGRKSDADADSDAETPQSILKLKRAFKHYPELRRDSET